jgi:hypothetical protein
MYIFLQKNNEDVCKLQIASSRRDLILVFQHHKLLFFRINFRPFFAHICPFLITINIAIKPEPWVLIWSRQIISQFACECMQIMSGVNTQIGPLRRLFSPLMEIASLVLCVKKTSSPNSCSARTGEKDNALVV